MSENPALASLALVGGAGTFENAPPVNGRPAWISYYKDYAIWYVPDYNSWVVGSSSQIGTGIMNLKGGDGTCPGNVTEWKVWNGLGYEETSEDDIKFECTEKGKCYNQALFFYGCVTNSCCSKAVTIFGQCPYFSLLLSVLVCSLVSYMVCSLLCSLVCSLFSSFFYSVIFS